MSTPKKTKPKTKRKASRKRAHGEPAPFPGHHHDHTGCRARALEHAEQVCAERGVRLTALRARVLELVWRSHKPMGAYDVLALLGRERGPVAPPTVYRALQFLTDHGLVHRIESLNAYVGCSAGGDGQACAGGSFLICKACGAAAELHDPDMDKLIVRRAEAAGFSVVGSTIEIAGICPDCSHAGKAA